MPTLSRLCNHPGCSAKAIKRSSFCTKHSSERDERRQSAKNRKWRPSASARGYDVKWRRVRAMYLKHHPVCVSCERAAEEVDHIIPLAKGGTHKWENLQALCKSCHSKKTVRENRDPDGKISARID